MSNTGFEIVEKEIGSVIEIEEITAIWKMPKVIGKNYERIMAYIKSQESDMSDVPYTHYVEVDWEEQCSKSGLAMFIEVFTKKWHFFVGMPTTKALPGDGDMKARNIELKKFVKGIHHGPYQYLGTTYKAMYAWIKEQNLSIKNESYECYMNSPCEVKKEDLETTILVEITE